MFIENIEKDRIYNCDCIDGLRSMEANSVDLTVTSPPYDNLRTYGSAEDEWNFDTFKPIAEELFRVTKPGGVVVWIIGDATIKGNESGMSFRQARFFQEIGFKLHDTMIYEKNSSSFPAKLDSKRYTQIFEYMFVFVKGTIRSDITLIADKKNKWHGWLNWGSKTQYNAEGEKISGGKDVINRPVPEYSMRTNIWRYVTAFNDKTKHPAVFPEKLAEDHILSWSVKGDTVLDPFMGSGTTAKMAKINGRHFIGFEKNKDYYEESLDRIEKYKFSDKDNHESVIIEDDVYTINTYEKKSEEEKKFALWKELTKELNEYFNTTTYSILKNLKVDLSFKSKSNDKRIQDKFNNMEPISNSEDLLSQSVELTEDEKELRNGELFTELPNFVEAEKPSSNYVETHYTFPPEWIETKLTDFCIEALSRGVAKFVKNNLYGIIKDGVFEMLTTDSTKIYELEDAVSAVKPKKRPSKKTWIDEDLEEKKKLKEKYQNGEIPELTKEEKDMLETCKELGDKLLNNEDEGQKPVAKRRGRPKGSTNKPKVINLEEGVTPPSEETFKLHID